MSLGGADEQLLDRRHRAASGFAEAGAVRIDRHFAPAEQHLAFGLDAFLDDVLAVLPFFDRARQKDVAGAVAAGLRQLGFQLALRELRKQLVRQGGEDAGAVAGVLLVADATAVNHAAVDVLGRAHDLVARHAFDVADEADAATVVFESGIV